MFRLLAAAVAVSSAAAVPSFFSAPSTNNVGARTAGRSLYYESPPVSYVPPCPNCTAADKVAILTTAKGLLLATKAA